MNNTNIVAGRPNPGAIIGGPAPVNSEAGGVRIYSCSSPDEETGRYARSLLMTLDPRGREGNYQLHELVMDSMFNRYSIFAIEPANEFLTLLVSCRGQDADDFRNRLVRVVGEGPTVKNIVANPSGKGPTGREPIMANPSGQAVEGAPGVALDYSGYGLQTGDTEWALLLLTSRTATDAELARASGCIIAELGERGIVATPGPATAIALPESRQGRLRFNGLRLVQLEPAPASAT